MTSAKTASRSFTKDVKKVVSHAEQLGWTFEEIRPGSGRRPYGQLTHPRSDKKLTVPLTFDAERKGYRTSLEKDIASVAPHGTLDSGVVIAFGTAGTADDGSKINPRVHGDITVGQGKFGLPGHTSPSDTTGSSAGFRGHRPPRSAFGDVYTDKDMSDMSPDVARTVAKLDDAGFDGRAALKSAGESALDPEVARTLEIANVARIRALAEIEAEDARAEPVMPPRTIDSVTAQSPTSAPQVLDLEVVEVRPFKSKHGMTSEGGKVYDSPAIREVVYADGTIRYRCALCGDEYERSSYRSIIPHYKKHSPEERAHDGIRPYLDPTREWTPTPRQGAVVSRLAREIEEAMIGGAVDPREIAEFIVLARVRTGDEAGGEPIAELTSDEIIARIRSLVDNGASVEAERQRAEQEQAHVAELTSLRDLLAAEREAIAAERVKMEADRREHEAFRTEVDAWRSLMPGANKEEDGQ